ANIVYLSEQLETLGIHTFLPPPHVERVYFEFLVRVDPEKVRRPMDALITALQAEGCQVRPARYPLVHQQPFFTEGHFASIARLPEGVAEPVYSADSLPNVQQGSEH